MPKSPIAKQYPIWNSDAKIEMSGMEFEAIHNILNAFKQAVMASESVMDKNIKNGNIQWGV